MRLRSLATVASLPLFALPLMAFSCSTTSPQLYKPEVAPSLLLPCVDPVLSPPDPSDNELAAAYVRANKAYIDCRDRNNALIKRVK